MKKWICILLAIAAAAISLTACGKWQKLDRVDVGKVKHITIEVDPSAADKTDYDIIRRAGMTQLVDMYNSARFCASDDKVTLQDLQGDGEIWFHFCFYSYDEELIGECTIYTGGYLILPDQPETVYQLQDGFDEDMTKDVMRQYDIKAKSEI